MATLGAKTRHRCFVSYHHGDEVEVQDFVSHFDHDRDVFVSRGIGAGMAGDIIDSNDASYIMRRVREKYMAGTTVTIVMIGRCTWSRKYVDWEVAASLRNNPTSGRSGLMAVTLPSVSASPRQLPPRVADNHEGIKGYARWWKYPQSIEALAELIEAAYELRSSNHLVDNSRALFSYNRQCG